MIRQLSEDVVRKIAAGEVVQRPANAVKELLENSIDAGATRVSITLRQGGLKLLQIEDNGSGVLSDDLKLLCTRFATSKLSDVTDLQTVITFGFRGEALASLAAVSHVSVTTRTENDAAATQAVYNSDGSIYQENKCARVTGTTIRLEDMFYNSPVRLRSLQRPPEEYSRCLSILSAYALHYSTRVSISCKRHDSRPDLSTKICDTLIQGARGIYGPSLSSELIEFAYSSTVDSRAQFSVVGLLSNANYNRKSISVLIFINNRLVENQLVQKTVDSVYSPILPRNGHPWVYLSFSMPPENVDVNMHPTKSKVQFLYEDLVCSMLFDAMSEYLEKNNSSRIFYTQTSLKLPKPCIITPTLTTEVHQPNVLSTAPKTKVRVVSSEPFGSLKAHFEYPEFSPLSQSTKKSNHQRELKLDSVALILGDIKRRASSELNHIFSNNSFVGMIDEALALVQFQTKLLILNVPAISNAFFFQQALNSIGGDINQIPLSPPISIMQLGLLALESAESLWAPEDGSKHDIAVFLENLLCSRSDLLEECFKISINPDTKMLVALPELLSDYEPAILRLPIFALRLGTEVEWEDEEKCFRDVCQELANLFQLHPPSLYVNQEPGSEWCAQHLLFPAFKRFEFYPPEQLQEDGSIVQVAALEKLYKVFERC